MAMLYLRNVTAACVTSMLLAGCATAPPTEPPAPWMLARPKPIADVKPGDDIIEKYAELRRDAGKDKSQIRGLQSYVKAIVKAK